MSAWKKIAIALAVLLVVAAVFLSGVLYFNVRDAKKDAAREPRVPASVPAGSFVARGSEGAWYAFCDPFGRASRDFTCTFYDPRTGDVVQRGGFRAYESVSGEDEWPPVYNAASVDIREISDPLRYYAIYMARQVVFEPSAGGRVRMLRATGRHETPFSEKGFAEYPEDPLARFKEEY